MFNRRFLALLVIILAALVAYFVYSSEQADAGWSRPFKLGLDLSGGSHLIYEADTSELSVGDIKDAMSSLREVIERRINAFGVSEPLIQVEQKGLGLEAKHRLIVELPGVTDLNEAMEVIKVTPLLEFKIERPEGEEQDTILATQEKFISAGEDAAEPTPEELDLLLQDPYFIPSGLTGRYLKRAQVQLGGQGALGPTISLEFNDEGKDLFATLTADNVDKPLAIYLDGVLLSAPIVREEIRDGRAEISGQFTVEEASELTRNLNLGALPVPIELISTETIGATLGDETLNKGIGAGLIAFAIVGLFMILWYRLPGLISVISLAIYVVLVLAIFKLLPVTLTAAGIAGFILSIGIAIDANVLIFERLKEELQGNKSVHEAINDGFSRAWLSIRDSNLSSVISSLVLFWFGTSLIKGFALTLTIGILISLFTAVTVTRTLLLALSSSNRSGANHFLFGTGWRSSLKQ
ncbi:MAG: protein translocase subunit SecD [Patescibacteria group bacterium]|nr:protein translocase subunit SecD [Patescibacteria group bacterium]